MKKALPGILLIIAVSIGSGIAHAQMTYQPYSFQFYEKLDNVIYSPSTSLHTSLKPYIIPGSGWLKHGYDSLMNRGVDTSHKSWIYRKLFNEHLIDVRNPGYTFYFDYLADLQIGRDLANNTSSSLNTRGFQAGGTIGSKFFFYTSGYENNATLDNYFSSYVSKTGMIPGQAFDFSQNAGINWTYVTSLVGYAPTNAISIETGVDKTFIGDGYRSMLLSDFASNYPLLRVKIDLGKKVRYMAMWAYLEDQDAPKADSLPHAPNRAKWGVFHYIDWNITNRASLGFFNALIAPDTYDNGVSRGFDPNYINPVLFVKSAAPSGPIPDNTFIGLNGKYKILNKTIIYAQLLYNQSSLNSQQGFQAGIRGADIFKINAFNYLFEYNTAKPSTYSSQYPLVNYSELDEPLAHPFGSGFKEAVGILSYSIGRFDFQGELDYAKYDLNANELHIGQFSITPGEDSQADNTGPLLNTTLKYAEGKISYLINPKFNLRLEAGAILRDETNAQYGNKTALITFGLRSSFRDLYTDF